MKKIQFGCGGNRINGWENYDSEIDISKTLPFQNNIATHVLAEHVMEHITIQQAWHFIEECYRILDHGGVLRLAVPCVSKIFKLADQEYFEFIKRNGWGDSTLKDAVKSIIFNHEHKTIWESSSLESIVQVIGFSLLKEPPAGMENTLNHYHVIGEKINNIETIYVDCRK
jgi:predicted SAM-dependent methyltransferase